MAFTSKVNMAYHTVLAASDSISVLCVQLCVSADQNALPDKEMTRNNTPSDSDGDEAVSMDARAHATLPRYTGCTT